MSKTNLSPIVAGVNELGVWIKSIPRNGKVNVCLENKITTFDHADIYGDYTTETDLEKHFLPAKSLEKLQFISNVGSNGCENRKTVLNITIF
jgi:predicted oxidoreductase